jgi:hypothetical protein
MPRHAQIGRNGTVRRPGWGMGVNSSQPLGPRPHGGHSENFFTARSPHRMARKPKAKKSDFLIAPMTAPPQDE